MRYSANRFHRLTLEQQGQLVQAVQDADEWHGFNAEHLWSLWTRYACTAFYSHPWAWNEMGFGGPAYPRGYKNMGIDRREEWERPEIDAEDPVPWAERRNENRPRTAPMTTHQLPGRERRVQGLGGGRQVSRLRDADIRARNESAWLVAHRRRAHQSSLAQRHAPLRRERRGRRGRRRLRGGRRHAACSAWPAPGRPSSGLDAGPFWDPDADWVSDEWGSHRLYWTEPRVISGRDPVPLGSNNSGRGVGGSMIHYAGYTPRFHPSDFETASSRRGRSRLAHQLRGPQALLRGDRRRAAGLRPAVALGGSPPLPLLAPTAGGQRGGLRPRRPCARHRDPHRSGGHRQRPLRPPAPLHLSGVLPPGLQGQRQGVAARSPTSPTPWRTGRRSGPTAMVTRVVVDERRPGHRRHLHHRMASSTSSGPAWWSWPVTPSRRPAYCCLSATARSRTGCATTTARSVAT